MNMNDDLRLSVSYCGSILGALYTQNPRDEAVQEILNIIAELPSFEEWPFGDESALSVAHTQIISGLQAPRKELAREYQRLFIGPHHFNAPAWGSVYLDKDQVVFGLSTIELRQWMRAQGISIQDGKREPEDHVGKMLILLGWLATGKPELIDEFLAEHLTPWVFRYLELLLADARQPFYCGVAILTETTLKGIVKDLEIEIHKKQLYR
jgi:TorA maturation chaperone TorD